MEGDLIERLRAYGALTAIVGNRINYLSRVQGETLPAITIMPVSPGRDYTMTGPTGSHGTIIQFDIWAGRFEQALQAFSALLTALEGPAVVGSTVFEMSFLQSRRDTAEEVQGEGTIGRVSADFLIWHHPA